MLLRIGIIGAIVSTSVALYKYEPKYLNRTFYLQLLHSQKYRAFGLYLLISDLLTGQDKISVCSHQLSSVLVKNHERNIMYSQKIA